MVVKETAMKKILCVISTLFACIEANGMDISDFDDVLARIRCGLPLSNPSGVTKIIEKTLDKPSTSDMEIIKKNLESTRPICTWSILDPLDRSNGEFEYYRDQTWDVKKTLEENQLLIKDGFLNACCKCLAKDASLSLLISGETKKFHAFQEEERVMLGAAVWEIVTNPIGCKLMRIMIAKYKVNKMAPDILFVFTNSPSSNPCSLISTTDHDKTKILIINVSQLSSSYLSLSRSISDTCNMYIQKTSSMGQIVFHELVHSLHNTFYSEYNKLIKMTSAIQKRFIVHQSDRQCYIRTKYGVRTVEKVVHCEDVLTGEKSESSPSQIFDELYGNDEEFRTITGIMLDKHGNFLIDAINENAFTFCGCGVIRATHTEVPEYHSFLSNFGDMEMWEFYLRRQMKFPKFGAGQYKCSDLAPESL